MHKISLQELPQYSHWPGRLLGITPFKRGERTVDDMLREYDADKYVELLEFLEKHPGSTIDDVRHFELYEASGKHRDMVAISQNRELFASEPREAHALQEKTFHDLIASSIDVCDTVIEFGSGYGYNLARLAAKFPNHTYAGGDLSSNAAVLGKKMLPEGIAIHPFNFYDDTYKIFDAVQSDRIMVLTYHSSEMLPDANVLIDRLAKYKDRIATVVQVEPVYELADKDDDMLDLLRRAYIRGNKYNENALTALQERSDVLIVRTKYDTFGLNPLFPESLLEWRFK